MPKITRHLFPTLAVCAICTLTGSRPLAGQTNNAPATNAPAATAPAPIAWGEVVTQAQAAETKLQQYQASLEPDATLQTVTQKLAELNGQIDDRDTQDAQLLKGSASLNTLLAAQAAWQSISDDLSTAQNDLSQRVTVLNKYLWDLTQMKTTWQATLNAPRKESEPSELSHRINDVLAAVAATSSAVMAHQTPLYTMQTRIAASDKLAQSGLDTVKKAIEAARAQLFVRNRPPLWESVSLPLPAAGLLSQEEASLASQVRDLTSYLGQKVGAVMIHLILLALLAAGCFWAQKTIHFRAKDEPNLQHTALVLAAPFSTALLFGLLATSFFYPDAPRLLWAAAGAVALLPAVIITRRLIDPANFPILYATVVAYLIDQVRYVMIPSGIPARFLFLAEIIAVCLFLLSAVRAKHLTEASTDTSSWKRITRLYLHATFFVLLFAGIANFLGYVQLSIVAGNGMLESSYLAVVFYAVVRVLDALAMMMLSIPPLSRLGMVRRHLDLLYHHVTVIVRWSVSVLWLILALKLFTVYDPLWDKAGTFLTHEYRWGSLDFQIGSVLAFPITIWASFLISRFIRFALEEEIYPHMQLSRGIPYAASTMVHYAILLLGFFIAVKAGGADLTQFSFLIGAFGVGLGFGLQNILNNFVSGIILLFERPIKVGDDIQIGADLGRVERIGIRASVILLTNGAEMIVPNGNLISNPVTNWTLTNCERLVEIPVTVTSKVDPQHVIDILLTVAKANPDVIRNPAPQALLVTFGATLVFRLRVWIDSEEQWLKITSDLSLAMNAALAKENIVLG